MRSRTRNDRRAPRARRAVLLPLLGSRVDLVSAADRRTHRARVEDFDAALCGHAATVPAVCGHDILICSAFTPFDLTCTACADTP